VITNLENIFYSVYKFLPHC